MTSIYPHKYGWKIRYKIYFPDLTYRIKYKYAKTKQKAILILKDVESLETLSLKNRLEQNDIITAYNLKYINKDDLKLLTNDKITEKITWASLEKRYITHITTVGSRQTQITYPHKLKPILEYFHEIPPEKITEETIRDYITVRRRTVSKATVNKELSILRMMLDCLTDNPARKVKRFNDTPTRLPRCLSPNEIKIIHNSMSNYYACYGYFSELIYAYLFTGMRRYELLELKTYDIDLRRKIIRIIGKGDKERIIEIHPYLSQVIIPSVKAKNGKNKGIYFFGGKDRPLMNENSIGRAFRIFLKKHNIYNENSLHTLRHTFITYLIESGASLTDVQRIAGHNSLKTTLRYTHLVPAEKPAINRLNYKIG